MGMLMHHTWLKQQEEKSSAEQKPAEKPEENIEDSEPVKKTGGRRKVSK